MGDVEFLTGPEIRVMRMFNRATAAVLSRIDADMEEACDLPRTYFDLLWKLRRAPGSSMRLSQLAKLTASKPSRITHAVSVLERRGLVVRRSVAGDRRGAVAVLTGDGLALAESAAPAYAQGARRYFLELLDENDRELLTAILERVLEAVDPDVLAEPLEDGLQQHEAIRR